MRGGYAEATAQAWMMRVRGFYTWANDGERSKAIDRAVTLGRKPQRPTRRPISQDEFEARLRAAGRQAKLADTLRDQSALWALWDTGFRSSELLAVRIDLIQFDGKGGAHIQLPDVTRLRTGPRTIYVCDCGRARRT